MDGVTFGGWHAGTTWTFRGNAAPMADDLAILAGDAKAYQRYALEYFESKLPLAAIAHVLAGKVIDAKILSALENTRSLAELKEDLAGIGYGG